MNAYGQEHVLRWYAIIARRNGHSRAICATILVTHPASYSSTFTYKMCSTDGQYSCMYIRNHFGLFGCTLLSISILAAAGQQPAQAPLPDIRQLMREVQEHQKQLDQIRENYTYTSYQVVQDIDANRPGEEDGVVGVRGLLCQRPRD